jgi:hypothetical protein
VTDLRECCAERNRTHEQLAELSSNALRQRALAAGISDKVLRAPYVRVRGLWSS